MNHIMPKTELFGYVFIEYTIVLVSGSLTVIVRLEKLLLSVK